MLIIDQQQHDIMFACLAIRFGLLVAKNSYGIIILCYLIGKAVRICIYSQSN